MRHLAAIVLLCLFAASCGGSDGTLPTLDSADGTCLVGDPECVDNGTETDPGALPDAVALGDPNGSDALLTFGGFFVSDGNVHELCSSLLESFPPQCGEVVIEIDASLEVALDFVAESFGNPDAARINIEQGIHWTDNWINLTGRLEDNRLVLE